LSPILICNLSSPSGITTCTALHAIGGFRRQYCSRCTNSDNYTFFLYFQIFTSVFREILKGRGLYCVNRHMQPLLQHYLKGLLDPFVSALISIQIPFCSLQKEISYRKQSQKNPRNKRVLHAVFEYLRPACKRVIDCLLNYCKRYSNTLSSKLNAESVKCMQSRF
jgi:hypothetical protein